ncbi:unnamed protein product [Prorocentrum cordatum]|uniref:Uncharacterized protein n=1 Tax=Prorocentrum cordatum TaxID=2364126 RepID=A0ABN9WG75_9DINO|nr:unnamed protein product [Polarella glacialis]
MARVCLAAVLAFDAIHVVSANVFHSMMKSVVCDQVPIPFVCPSPKSKGQHGSGGSSASSASSGCSGDSCCPSSSCYGMPGMGCASSRGSVSCLGSSFPFTQGQCQCTGGASCSSGVCAGGAPRGSSGMLSGLSDLFDAEEVVRVPREDHSLALALYTGGACLLAAVGLSAGVRQQRRRSLPRLEGGDEQRPAWELLEQASSSGE